MDDDMVELEGRPRRPLMLKEWMELESSAELSRDGFGCYPRHLAAELRRSASVRRGNGDVIARFSAAVRAALARPPLPPAGRETEAAAALSRSLSRRLRVGFWKKRRGEAEETDRPMASCSATAASSGRRDAAASSSPAMSPRRVSWEGRQVAGRGGGAGLSAGRASQELLERIRRFEQLAQVDTSDADDATTTTEDASCHAVEELGSNSAGGDEDEPEGAGDLLGLQEATSPSTCDAGQRFRGLLRDFFREGLSSSCHDGDGPDVERSLLETARAWLDGRHGALRSDGKAEVEEIERLGRCRCFREDEQELLGCDVESDIFLTLMEELIVDLC
nr:unnamed protein product [Digitaria exilis]